MSQSIMVPNPLSQEAAQALRDDPAKLTMASNLLNNVLKPLVPGDPLVALMNATGRSAQAAGLSGAAVDAELAAWNDERRA